MQIQVITHIYCYSILQMMRSTKILVNRATTFSQNSCFYGLLNSWKISRARQKY